MLNSKVFISLLLLLSLKSFALKEGDLKQGICRAGIFKNPNTFIVEQDVKALGKDACKELKSKAEAICRAGIYSNFNFSFSKEVDRIFVISVCSQIQTEAEAICLAGYYSNHFAKIKGIQKWVIAAEESCSDLR
ncbi:MAG: hypothetical protein VX642_06630 [Bdellovibrionota bacterium]|nr:hypothetical protein [Bdellovibrionota bacterium]